MADSTHSIKKITLQSGMLKTLDDKSKCTTICFEGEAIPKDVLETLAKDNYKSLKLRYGDPSWGDPIQYDLMTIEDEEGTKIIEIFNRVILLMFNNTEEIRRAHRVIYAVEKYKEKKGITRRNKKVQ
ncbi:MAG: hypothetical protein HXY47_06035 [Nitrospirae bacterium]|nr:hypothetical protein [Nitrospirota bacterium]